MITRLLIYFGLLFFSSSLFSQEKKIDPNVSKKIIILTNKTKNKKVKFLKDNSKIVYKLQGDKKKYKGKMQIINDSVIAIKGQEIILKNLTMVGGRSVGLKATKILGATVMAGGVTLSTIGVIFYIQSQNKEGCESSLGQIIGTFMFAGGAVVAVIGSIPLAIKPKHFDLNKKWDIKVGFVEK